MGAVFFVPFFLLENGLHPMSNKILKTKEAGGKGKSFLFLVPRLSYGQILGEKDSFTAPVVNEILNSKTGRGHVKRVGEGWCL